MAKPPKKLSDEFKACAESVLDGNAKMTISHDNNMSCEYTAGPKKGTVIGADGPKP